MPNTNTRKKAGSSSSSSSIGLKKNNNSNKKTPSAKVGGGRRPATATAIIITEGNVNNNGRVNNDQINVNVSSTPAIVTASSRQVQLNKKKEIRPEQLESGGVVLLGNLQRQCGSVVGVQTTGGGDEIIEFAKAVSEASSEDGNSPGGGGSSEEEPGSQEECQSFYVIVNSDGSLSLDHSKQAVLGPGQERFPVNLPKSKVKSPSNPLPGAVPLTGQRTRKSKPEGVTYGGSTDVGFITSTSITGTGTSTVNQIPINTSGKATEVVAMSVGINQAHVICQSSHGVPGTTGTIDMDEFTNQLDPQSLATLETLIQSEQGREIIETLELDQHPVQMARDGGLQEKPSGWDHGYNNKNSGGDSSASSVTGSNVGALSPSSSAANSPGGSRKFRSGDNKGRVSTSSRLSEGDSGNIRRSQRQQDRIERQEAERILAENQQMLQREKEIMKEKEVNAQIASAASSPTLKAVGSPQVLAPITVTKTSPVVAQTLLSSPRDSVDSSSSDKRPYPKRENRKLPAHLADPNIISLEEDGSKPVPEKISGSRRSSIQATATTDTDEIAGNEASADDADDEDYTEDDPNRLWCICQQPHNNRFMICCDTCEDWFHGKCVNVTKAQGKAMELKNVPWNCPPCRKTRIEKEKKTIESTKGISKRKSESPVKPIAASSQGQVRLSKAAAAQQAEAAAAANASKLALTPEKIASQSSSTTKKLNVRRSESLPEKNIPSSNVSDCIVCGKTARKDSVYCSDLCVTKFSDTLKSESPEKGKPVTTTSPTTPNSAQSKLKRANSLKPDGKLDEPIFAFHVITPGASKSTEIVPPKPRELTASQLLKAQREQAAFIAAGGSGSPTKVPSIPSGSQGVSSIASSTPTVVVKKITTADGKSVVKLPGKISKESPLKIDSSNDKARSKEKESSSKPRTRTSSASEIKSNKIPTSNSRKSERDTSKSNREKEFDRDREGVAHEKLHRENIKKGIRELLKTRLKEMTADEQKKISEGSNTPEILAEKIEKELCRVYGGANNPKCKSKYRSIYFNLKDSKNCMYQEILLGILKPKALVKMEAHEMASAELAEWRKQESQKGLEAIKKAELDKYAEAKKMELLEKSGWDDAANVADETRSLDISDIIDSNDNEKSEKDQEPDKLTEQYLEKDKNISIEKHRSSSSGSHNHSKRDKDKSSSSNSRSSVTKSKDKHSSSSSSDKDRRRSERHKERERESSSKIKDKESRHSSSKGKDKLENKQSSSKVKHSDIKVKDSHITNKESEHDIKSSSIKEIAPLEIEEKKGEESLSNSPVETSNSEELSSSVSSQSDVKKTEPVRHSTDSEQELPSSTIKTPDFMDDASAKKDTDSKHLFHTRIVMPELGGFNASAHAVSHFATEGLIFPESPVPIVGRISPETVWDYINKMKKSKEVIILRLAPASPADSEGYMTFFSYFSSRGRLGVIGGITSPLKDVYLVPLDKHSPINRSLLPFRGPGLPQERTHCLLCVVTRHVIGDIPPGLAPAVKRKSSVAEQLSAKKKVKFGLEQKPKTRSSARSSPATPSAEPPSLKKMTTDSKEKGDDDDAPYDPWEEEDEEEKTGGGNNLVESTSEVVEDKPPILIPEILPPPPPQSIDVQKQLQELEAKIEKERQDIEKIAGALAGRNSMSGIPGLDGEFEEGGEAIQPPKQDGDHVPFFLRSEDSTKKIPLVDKKTKVLKNKDAPESSESSFQGLSSKESLKDDCDVLVLLESQSKGQTETIEKKSEDLEEAYSPSGMQFSDEEQEELESNRDKSVVTKPKVASITIIQTNETSLLPPGVDLEEFEGKKSNLTEIPKPDQDLIKIVLKKPAFASTLAPVGSFAETTANSDKHESGDIIIDLEDLEPPPPGEIVEVPVFKKVLPPLVKKSEVENESGVFAIKSAAVISSSKASPSTSTSGGGFKGMKININLTTKQLPSKEEELALGSDTKSNVGPTSNPPQFSFGILGTCPPLKSKPSISIPIHIPPPALKQVPTLTPQITLPLPNVLQPPPNLTQPPPRIPVHIPPPTLASVPSVPSSVVINLNIPPPSISSMRPISMPPSSSNAFPSRPPFSSIGKPFQLESSGTSNPPRPSFVSSFNLTGSSGNGPSSFAPDDQTNKGTGDEPDSSVGELNRVPRLNLDQDAFSRDNRGRNNHGRDFGGRSSYGRRHFDRDRPHGDRRKNRSKSVERDRSRSRSKSRERRHRRRQSKSRSKSPLSKRWEARNRSRSPAKRNRRRSRSSSLSRRLRDRVARSPRRSSRKSKSPSTPSKSKPSTISSESKLKPGTSNDDDWETPSPLRFEESTEKTKKIESKDPPE